MNKINRQELAKAIHENAVAKGFWDEKYPPEHYLMLVITELGEAVEAWRKDKHANREAFLEVLSDPNSSIANTLRPIKEGNTLWTEAFEVFVKDSVADELADAYIRLLDLAEGFDYKLKQRYTESEEVDMLRRLGKIEFAEQIFSAVEVLIKYVTEDIIDLYLGALLDHIEAIAKANDIDLAWQIEEKMKYNATRPHLHGKKC